MLIIIFTMIIISFIAYKLELISIEWVEIINIFAMLSFIVFVGKKMWNGEI